MLPSLDHLQTRVATWRQAAWPVQGGLAVGAATVLTVGWPAVVGAGYAIVVWSRLRSNKARYVLVGLMAASSLMAQGAWTHWMVAGLFTHAPAASMADNISPDSANSGQVAGVSTGNNGSTATGQVLRVIDGAHLEVSILDQAYVVELIGLASANPGSQTQPPACFGQESQQYLQGLVGTGQVQLTTDGQLTDRNDLGQMLRYVVGADGSLVNRQMIDAGMAMVQSGDPSYEQQVAFLSAQEAAKAAGRGLWGNCLTTTPSPTPAPDPSTTPTPTTTPTPSTAVKLVVPTPTAPIPSNSTPTPNNILPTPSLPTPTPTPVLSPSPTESVQSNITTPAPTE